MYFAKVVCVASVTALLGCSTVPRQPPGIPVTQVIEQLKRELAYFASETNGKELARSACTPKDGPPFKMNVKAVSVELNTTFADESALTAEAAIPLAAGAVTLGPSGGFSSGTTNSQKVVLNFVPEGKNVAGSTPGVKTDYVLAKALLTLRDQLIAVKSDGACLRFDDDPANMSSLELAFTAESTASAGVKFNVVVLSVGAGRSRTVATGNVITVFLDFGGVLLLGK